MGNVFSCGPHDQMQKEMAQAQIPSAPSEEHIDAVYDKLLQTRGITAIVREEMIRFQDKQSKWYIVFFNAREYEKERVGVWSASNYVEQLLTLHYGGNGLTECLNSIQTSIAKYSRSWVQDFLSSSGIEALTKLLPGKLISDTNVTNAEFNQFNEVLKTFSVLGQFKTALDAIVENLNCIRQIHTCFYSNNVQLQTRSLQLLGVLCYHSNAGHQKVLSCFEEYQYFQHEQVRFETMIAHLTSRKQTSEFKANVITFINVLVNSEMKLENRVAIRSDMIHHGILEFIEYYRGLNTTTIETNPVLLAQMDVFQEQYQKDRKDTLHSTMDLSNVEDVFDALYARTKLNPHAYENFMKTLKYMLLVPNDHSFSTEVWQTIEQVVSRVTLDSTYKKHSSSVQKNYIDEKHLLDLREHFEGMLRQSGSTFHTKSESGTTGKASSTSEEYHSNLLEEVKKQEELYERKLQVKELLKDHLTCDMLGMASLPTKSSNSSSSSSSSSNSNNSGSLPPTTSSTSSSPTKSKESSFDGDKPTLLLQTKASPTKKEGSHQPEKEKNKVTEVLLKDHPVYAKYFKLLQLGMPLEQVQQKVRLDGHDASLLLLSPQSVFQEKTLIPISSHPKYVKFFKLLQFHMPAEQVRLKMTAEGLNPDYLLTPDQLVDEQVVNQYQAGAILRASSLSSSSFTHNNINKNSTNASALMRRNTVAGASVEATKSADGLLDASSSGIARRDTRVFYWEPLANEAIPGTIWETFASSPTDEETNKETNNEKDKEERNKEERNKKDSPATEGKKVSSPVGTEAEEGKAAEYSTTTSATSTSTSSSSTNSSSISVVFSEEDIPELKILFATPSHPRSSSAPTALTFSSSSSSSSLASFPSSLHVDSPGSSSLNLLASEGNNNNMNNHHRLSSSLSRSSSHSKLNQDGSSTLLDTSMPAIAVVLPLPPKIFLLDHSRANNISIIVKRFKLSFQEIYEAIMRLDETQLQVEQLQSLLSILPTKEEMNTLKAYTGNVEHLNDPEQLSLKLLAIPRLGPRLVTFILKLQFPSTMLELKNKIKLLRTLSHELSHCTSFKTILHLILQLGNVLNQGTSHGNATGFKLKNLEKLGQIKASHTSKTAAMVLATTTSSSSSSHPFAANFADLPRHLPMGNAGGSGRRMTLLHYLAQLLRKKNASIIEFHSEMPSLSDIAQFSSGELEKQMKELDETSDKMKTECHLHENHLLSFPDPQQTADNFQEVMKPFIAHARHEMKEIKSAYGHMVHDLKQVMHKYGEPTSSDAVAHASTFFQYVHHFSVALRRADEMNLKEEQDEERKQKRKSVQHDARRSTQQSIRVMKTMLPTSKAGVELVRATSLNNLLHPSSSNESKLNQLSDVVLKEAGEIRQGKVVGSEGGGSKGKDGKEHKRMDLLDRSIHAWPLNNPKLAQPTKKAMISGDEIVVTTKSTPSHLNTLIATKPRKPKLNPTLGPSPATSINENKPLLSPSKAGTQKKTTVLHRRSNINRTLQDEQGQGKEHGKEKELEQNKVNDEAREPGKGLFTPIFNHNQRDIVLDDCVSDDDVRVALPSSYVSPIREGLSNISNSSPPTASISSRRFTSI